MHRAALENATLEYEDSGAGDPIVFIHGACIADAFRPLVAQPALAGYRRITYRRRGYAGSSRPEGFVSLRDQALDCLDLLRYLGIPRAHLVGHSWGGAAALQLALEAPDAVHSLALLEPALMTGTSAAAYRESLRRGVQSFRESGGAVAVHELLQARWPGYRAGLEQALPGAFDQAVTDASAAFETELPALLDWTFTEDEARRIGQPVLSVLGERSAALSPRFAEAHDFLLDTLPNAEGYVLPKAHHFLQVENPHDMAGALAAFYARHPLKT